MATTPKPSATAGIESVPVKKRVFLADDHAMVREGLAAALENTGEFKVVGQCGNGLEVIEQVIEIRPDAVVLDVNMPGYNGVDVCFELKRRMPDAVVLMLSMHADEEFILRALESGARGYLLKESVGLEFVKALKAVMAGRVYLGSGIDKNILTRMGKPRQNAYETLSPRERQVLQMIAEGLTSKKIAEALGRAVKTVDTQRMRLMKKLDIHDVTTLVKFYWKHNGGLMP